jgi:hypothetical protein
MRVVQMVDLAVAAQENLVMEVVLVEVFLEAQVSLVDSNQVVVVALQNLEVEVEVVLSTLVTLEEMVF